MRCVNAISYLKVITLSVCGLTATLCAPYFPPYCVFHTLLAIGSKGRLYVLLITDLVIRKTSTKRLFRCKAVKERRQFSIYISR